jgi:hypothetical protein
MSVELKVVQKPSKGLIDSIFDSKNNPLWADRIFKGAIPIATVDDFVSAAVQTNASKGLIDFIQINGHGNIYGFQLGKDFIELKTIDGFQGKLAKVAPLLSPNCCVEISACKAGHATELMRKFSHILGGVTIVGYLLSQGGGEPPTGPSVVVTPWTTHTPPKLATGVSPPSPPVPSN